MDELLDEAPMHFLYLVEEFLALAPVLGPGQAESIVENEDVLDIEVAFLQQFENILYVVSLLKDVVIAEFGEKAQMFDDL